MNIDDLKRFKKILSSQKNNNKKKNPLEFFQVRIRVLFIILTV